MSNSSYENSFNSLIDKKILLYKMSYFPEPYTRNKSKIKVELFYKIRFKRRNKY